MGPKEFVEREQIKKAESSKLCLALQKKKMLHNCSNAWRAFIEKEQESPGINARLTIFATAAKENLHYKENYFHNSH
jgi:hypothetical protein